MRGFGRRPNGRRAGISRQRWMGQRRPSECPPPAPRSGGTSRDDIRMYSRRPPMRSAKRAAGAGPRPIAPLASSAARLRREGSGPAPPRCITELRPPKAIRVQFCRITGLSGDRALDMRDFGGGYQPSLSGPQAAYCASRRQCALRRGQCAVRRAGSVPGGARTTCPAGGARTLWCLTR